MKPAVRKWLGRGLLASIALVVAASVWLLGSTTGTRWILARAANWLPEALTLGEVDGSLLGGVRFNTVGWSDESLELSVRNLFLHVELQPLLRRQVRIEELDAEAVGILIPAGRESDAEFSLPEFSIPVSITIAEFSLRNLEIRQGENVTSIDSVSASGGMRDSRIELDSLSVEAETFGVAVDGSAEFARPHPADLRARWHVNTENGEFSGHAAIDGDSNRYALTHELESPFAISTSGSLLDVGGNMTADVRNEWASVTWPVAEQMLETRDGSLTLRGNLDTWDVVLQTFARWGDVPETSLALEGSGDRERLSITSLFAESGESRIGISGVTEWAPQMRVQIEYDAPHLDLALLDPWLDIPFSDEPLRSTGGMNWTAERLELQDAEFAVGSNTLAIDGFLGETLDVDARFFLLAIGELFSDAAGTLQGELTVSGTAATLTGNAMIQGSDLAWQQFSAGKLVANVQSLEPDTYRLEVESQDFVAAGTAVDSAVVSLSGSVIDHDAQVRITLGNTGINAQLSGGVSAAAWQGTLSSFQIDDTVFGRWVSTNSASLDASAEGAGISRLCLASASGNACVQGEYAAGGPVSMDLALTGVPPRALPMPLPDTVQVGGTISGDARADILDGKINGTGAMRWDGAVFETTVDGETLAVALSAAVATAELTDNRLDASLQVEIADAGASAQSTFQMEDVFDTGSAIGGEAAVAVTDAAVFAFLLPDVSNLGGSVNGKLSVTGNLQLPELTGEISLSDGTFRARQTGVLVSDFDLTLRQQAPGQLELRGSARSGDGRVTVTGDTTMGSDTGIRTELAIAGADFEVARLPDLAVTASPDLVVVFDQQLTSITGDLDIPGADIVVRTLPETAVSASRDAVVHRAGITAEAQRRRRTDVDVLASLGDRVSFAGFGLTADVSGALRIRGGSHAPFVGAGQLTLRNGRYKAYGQDLEIERGELIFNGPLDNPELNVRATRQAGDVTAGIRLSGTPNNLRSDVFSEPVLSDAETLSYLLTGRPLGGGGEDGDTLNKAAFALGLSGAGKVASQVRAGLGLETLQIEGGADDGRIIAGKRIGGRLLVEYGYGIIDKLGTLLLRYQLNDRLVLESRTGTVSNLDIVYSVKKK